MFEKKKYTLCTKKKIVAPSRSLMKYKLLFIQNINKIWNAKTILKDSSRLKFEDQGISKLLKIYLQYKCHCNRTTFS